MILSISSLIFACGVFFYVWYRSKQTEKRIESLREKIKERNEQTKNLYS